MMRDAWSGSLLLCVAETIPIGIPIRMVKIAAQIASSAVYANLFQNTTQVLAVPAIPGSNVNPQLPVNTLYSHAEYCPHNGTMHLGASAAKASNEGQVEVATPNARASESFPASPILGLMYGARAVLGGRRPRVK